MLTTSNPMEEEVKPMVNAIGIFKTAAESREIYSKLRSDREKATFAMMMRMNPEALMNIRKEFFARRDTVDLDEFICITQKHLAQSVSLTVADKREFGMKMVALFRDIDVNGDGHLEWQEFTTYVVEKANLLNKRMKLTNIPHYYDSSESLDADSQYRHRNDISKMVKIPYLNQFAMVEDHKNSIFVFNSRSGKHVTTIATESPPIALEYASDKDLLVASCSDMTLATYTLDDPNPNRRYKQKSTWATPGVQMAIAHMSANNLLYSAGTTGNLYSWKIADRSLVSTFAGHTDIVMALTVLKKLNNIASGSLDKTVNVWDSYTNARILELQGHKKGVLDMTYNSEYRLLFSCGFEHEACIWSPFVNSLVYRLKGHHASLVGIEAIEDTPELITADISGVFKLWDIRNYQCVQTFTANLTGSDTKDGSKLSCFFQTTLPARNAHQKETDSRIFGASKMLLGFDQARVVHDATTDFSIVHWVGWSGENSLFVTASERNVIVWDALIGSKTVICSNICGDEISACCLDDRRRKIVIGDIHGNIGVYNPSNGAIMKYAHDTSGCIVVALQYVNSSRYFIAGFVNGLMRIYDENSIEDCSVVRTFEAFNMHPELLCLSFNETDNTVATAGASSGVVRLWDYTGGKSEVELKVCDNADYIVMVTYLLPFPLVATADSKGNVNIWGSRGCKWTGARIAGFMNTCPSTAEEEPPIYEDLDGEPLPCRTFPRDDLSGAGEGAGVVEGSNTPLSPPPAEVRRQSSRPVTAPKEEEGFGEENASAVAARKEFAACEKKWGRVTPAYNITFDAKSSKLFTTDDMGVLRCFSLHYLLEDIGAADMISKDPNVRAANYLRGICVGKRRDGKTAPPPIYERQRHFRVGRHNDAMSFLGIEFCWALPAHEDRIAYCMCTPDGVLTSGADRLLKMWTFDGKPIGVLLQSVPIGARSSTWNLELDAEILMQSEEKMLDTIMLDVNKLQDRPDNPNIATMDFRGIEPGVEAADFSRSELRKRIEMTGEVLGIDFPTDAELLRRSSVVSVEGGDTETDAGTSKSKSLMAAMKELKSSSAAVDYDAKNKTLSLLQKRRKATKMNQISNLYQGKGGMRFTASNDLSFTASMSNAEDDADDNFFSKSKGSPSKLGAPDDATFSITQQSSSSNNSYAVTKHKVPSPLKQAGKALTGNSKAPVVKVGSRAELMEGVCSKHNSYDALQRALERRPKDRISPAELAELKQRRQSKLKSVAAASTRWDPEPEEEASASAVDTAESQSQFAQDV